jgi:hypothetical protein
MYVEIVSLYNEEIYEIFNKLFSEVPHMRVDLRTNKNKNIKRTE